MDAEVTPTNAVKDYLFKEFYFWVHLVKKKKMIRWAEKNNNIFHGH